ncbi:MAG TPA: cyclase family protein [Terriglobia bacterium]|nr:cyclase family protein [Terriglobia bacterium]
MVDISAWLDTLRNFRVVDLSQTLEEHAPHYPTHSKFYHNLWSSYWHGDRSLTYQVTMNEHSGTHVDAPAHFISDAKPAAHVTIDRVPVSQLLGRGVRIDCRNVEAGETVPRAALDAWEENHGSITAGDVVLFNFGWSSRWALRPRHQSYITDWPGVAMDTAEYLIDKRVAAIGVDTLSPDAPAALRSDPIHPRLLEKQILIVENLCNLDQLPDFFVFLALPLKIGAGSGSPVRPVALF